MNKKVALILSLFIALLSIVMVSTFGLLPEDLRENIRMTSLTFNVATTTTDSGPQKIISMNFKANNNTIDLYSMVVIAPVETTNASLQYSTDQPASKVAVSATGMLTIYDLTLTSFTVSVKSTDGSNLIDYVTIMKPSGNESHFGDEWDWG